MAGLSSSDFSFPAEFRDVLYHTPTSLSRSWWYPAACWSALRRGRGGLSAAEATQLINRRNAVDDVRAASDFAAGHLPSARAAAAGEIGTKIAQVAKNKSTPLRRQNGQQSQKAAREVEAAGYAEVHVLEGGGRLAAGRDAGRQTRSGEVNKVLMYSTQVSAASRPSAC